jgi:hypothetical protein
MSQEGKLKQFWYRDKSLDCVRATLEYDKLEFRTRKVFLKLYFDSSEGHKEVSLCVTTDDSFKRVLESMRAVKDRNPETLLRKLLSHWGYSLIQIMKYLILWDRIAEYEETGIYIDSETPSAFPAYFTHIQLVFTLSEHLQIEENRIARRLALKIAYERAQEGIAIIDAFEELPEEPEEVRVSGLREDRVPEAFTYRNFDEKEISFPSSVFENAVRTLESAGLLRLERGLGPPEVYRITLKGQLKYEESFAAFQDKAFIIASCTDTMRPIVQVYKDILAEPEFNLEGIFQENEEPEKSIHLDIFDYIQNVPLIVADLTGHRSNCYLELGYAMALNKRIILALDENDRYYPGTEKDRLAFDTTPMKYTFYKDIDDLKEKIRERIRVSLNMIRKTAEI